MRGIATRTPDAKAACQGTQLPDMGPIYVISAIVLGAVFLALSYKVVRDQDTRSAMQLFGYSITYVTLLFGAMAVDQLVRSGF